MPTPDHDSIDKVITAMKSLMDPCQDEFRTILPVLNLLDQTYSLLADEEDDPSDFFYYNLAHEINNLITFINYKDEL